MKNKRLEKQLEFALEINKEKNIFRQTHVDSERCENDAEHSWHIAVMIYLLREYANENFDVAKSQIYRRNEKTPTGSAELWEFMKTLVERNIQKGTIRDE